MRASVLFEQGRRSGWRNWIWRRTTRARCFDLPRLVTLYRAGKLRIDELITRRYALDEANEAFRALASGELARGLVVF